MIELFFILQNIGNLQAISFGGGVFVKRLIFQKGCVVL